MIYKRFKATTRCPYCHRAATLKEDGVVNREDGALAHTRCLLSVHKEDAANGMDDVLVAFGHDDMRKPFRSTILAEGIRWAPFILLIEQTLQKLYAVEVGDEVRRKSVLMDIAAIFSKMLMVDIRCESSRARREYAQRALTDHRIN